MIARKNDAMRMRRAFPSTSREAHAHRHPGRPGQQAEDPVLVQDEDGVITTQQPQYFAQARGASPEHGVEGYPYLLVTGRLLEHYNVGTMTRRGGLSSLVADDYLEINPQDAQRDAVSDGSTIRVESRWGSTEVTVRHSVRVAPATLFLTFHFPGTHANRLTGPTIDPRSHCPQYKATAVRLLPPDQSHG